MIDESTGDEDRGREAQGGFAVPGSSVGVAAELAVVRPPRVRGLDDPAEPQVERLLLARRLGAAPLDQMVIDAERCERRRITG